jgi:hypothetical protein
MEIRLGITSPFHQRYGQISGMLPAEVFRQKRHHESPVGVS